MQITTYRTITNQIRTSSLKKLSNRNQIELTKNLIEQTKLELKLNRIPNKL
jgi:hypothetical protein